MWDKIVRRGVLSLLVVSMLVGAVEAKDLDINGNEKAGKAIDVEVLARLYAYLSELLYFEPQRPLEKIRADVTEIETALIKSPSKFNALKSSVIKVAMIKGSQRPLQAMRLCPSFGELMKCRDISPSHLAHAGYPKVAKNLEALIQHMKGTGKWEQVKCK